MKALLLLLLVAIVFSQSVGDKQITQVDFLSNFSLGKQDQLNKTFTIINQKLPTLPDITFKVNENVTYQITNIETPRFFYVDSKQKATIQDQEIAITGGYLETDFKFNWQRKNSSGVSVNGTASGFGFSDQIILTKGLIDDREKRVLYYNLTDYQNVTFDGGFRVVRVTPQTITQDDMVSLRKMLNYIQGQKAVKDNLMENINSIFAYFLKQSLQDQKFQLLGQFNYTYQRRHDPSKGKFVVNMTADLKDVVLDRTGIKYDWKTNITGDPKWTYNEHTIGLPFSPKIYGGVQEMISLTVYENLARYAMQNGQLNSDLNRQNWQSKFFQFYCGDLYQVIPKVAQVFMASEVVDGLCNAIPSSFSIKMNTIKTLLVKMEYDCSLNANKRKITDFNVKMNIQIQGKPRTDSLHFQIIGVSYVVVFSDYMDFKIENKELAQMMVKHSMNRIYQTEVFGSGWKLLKRDYPHFHVQKDFTLIYDSTHVETEAIQQ